MGAPWVNFYLAAAGASAGLTGLLFVAVSLRPREIRNDPLMVGRARSAFYSFQVVLFAAFLALAAFPALVVGATQSLVAAAILAGSAPFTLNAIRARQLNYKRAAVYHIGLVLVIVAGLLRLPATLTAAADWTLAAGVLLLLAIALSNSWQLVISHGADQPT